MYVFPLMTLLFPVPVHSYISQIKKKYLKDPRPLKSKKRFLADKNNSMWGVTESRGVRGLKT